MSEIAKTKWLPRHLLSFYIDTYILSIKTTLMSYAFASYEYYYLDLSVVSFNKTILKISIGRNERMEKAHEVYKRMSDEYRNVPDDRTVGIDEGEDTLKELKKGIWKGFLNR